MFGISETELIMIVVFGFLIFGPDKLPGMGRTLGRMLRQFREAQEGFTEVVQTEVMDPLNDVLNDPLDEGANGKKRREEALAEDADIDLPEGGAAPKRETFAERKARLAAEREAAAAAAAAAAATAEEKAGEGETSEEAAPEAAQEEAVEPATPEEPEEPDTSASALYAMGGRSSGYRSISQKKADEAAAKAEVAAKAAAESEPAPEPEPTPKHAAKSEPEPMPESEPAPAPAGPTKLDEGGEGSTEA